MKWASFALIGFFVASTPFSVSAGEIQRLQGVIQKRDKEIRELRKEIDLLHRQLAEEQPGSLAERQAAPRPAPAEQPAKAPVAATHVVASGDTLSAIARKHGVTVAALRKANHLSGNLIRPGQKLSVPATDKASKEAPPSTAKGVANAPPVPQPSSPAPGPVKTSEYVVKAGDTLHSISRRHKIKVSQLEKANPGIDPRRLRIGQKIRIPGNGESRQTRSVTAVPAPQEPRNESQPVLQQQATPKHIIEVELEKEMTFEQFARQQGMTMARLNELNGHKLAPDELLAATSIFLVEK